MADIQKGAGAPQVSPPKMPEMKWENEGGKPAGATKDEKAKKELDAKTDAEKVGKERGEACLSKSGACGTRAGDIDPKNVGRDE